MQKTLSADLTRVSKDKDKVKLEITKNNYEAFCNAVGLYNEEFLEALKRSEADHKAGRIIKMRISS